MTEKFDLIVVGAGPAGLAAAYTAAKGGLKVLVLERGEYPGAKNVMGGVLYSQPTAEVIPNFWRQAPVERPVVENNYWLMTKDSAIKMGYRTESFSLEPYNSFTVLRAKFDAWFGKQVEEAGAVLVTETVVTELISLNGKVVGVRTDRPQGEVYAELVILAEGVNSLLTQQARMSTGIPPQHLAVAVKEIISLPAEVIESRFGLEPGQGAVFELVGDATKGMMGTAFLYTNKNSLSIGVGAMVSQVVSNGVNPNDLLEYLKAHPSIKPLLHGGEVKEYMAHMIPEGGYDAIPQLAAPGMMVVGDAAMLVNSIRREGSNLAVLSGKMAGQTAINCFKTGDFSMSMLETYPKALAESFILKDLKQYRHAAEVFETNPQFFGQYPDLMDGLMKDFFTVDGIPKKVKQKQMWERVMRHRSMGELAMDAYKIWRGLV